MKDMELKNLATLRMIEGGRYNVNIRRITAPSTEYHDITADTWVILKGGGTASTGFERTPTAGVSTAPVSRRRRRWAMCSSFRRISRTDSAA